MTYRGLCRVPAIPPPVERAPPVAMTNKTPIYEYYGFVMYLVSFVGLGIYQGNMIRHYAFAYMAVCTQAFT